MLLRTHSWSKHLQTYQAVQLGHWTLAARLADVPDLDATLAASVDVPRGVADGDGADHFPVAQRVDLASVARDARAYQCIRWEGHWLHLSVRTHVKRISSAKDTGTETRSVRVHWLQVGYGLAKTHGFPPGMEVRLAGRPGALM